MSRDDLTSVLQRAFGRLPNEKECPAENNLLTPREPSSAKR